MAKKYSYLQGYTPLNYSQISNIEGRINPSMVKYCDSATFAYWQRSLFQRAISTIEFKNLPEKWEGNTKDFFYWCIFSYGHVGVFNEKKFGGICFQPGNFYGFDFYYQPTEYIVANPKLSKRFKIHENCEIIKLTPDFRGIWDIITYYSMMLSMLDTGINMSIINNKFAFVLGAKNKAAAETLKKIFDKINAGEPATIFDSNNLLPNDPTTKEEPWNFLERTNLKQSYLTTDQLMDRSTILAAFDAEIGITTLPYNKKERLVTAEANSRNEDATARLMVWKETLESSLKLVNQMFNTNISISMRYEEMREEDIINGSDFRSNNTDRD